MTPFDILIGIAPILAWSWFWMWFIDYIWDHFGTIIIYVALELELMS